MGKCFARCIIVFIAVFITACSANTAEEKHNGQDMLSDTPKEAHEADTPLKNEFDNSLNKKEELNLIDPYGDTVQKRINVPEGFERIYVEPGSFGEYLRNLPLKPYGSKVKYYNGDIKHREVYEAVLDIDVGDRDLQQCADAVIRLRAEYLYAKGQFDRICFSFTNGFRADYSKWVEGNRIKVNGNNVYWEKQTGYCDDYNNFREYLNMVFTYAGTLSLSQEMVKIPVEQMQIGDVFLEGGSPGHCVIVIDMAQNRITREKIFILAQSYMPAQDIHILKNPLNREGNPWYSLNFNESLITPEWVFEKEQLYRFNE